MKRAEHAQVDLVEVGPDENPPTCKLFDVGKKAYMQKKAARDQKRDAKTKAKSKGRSSTIKEVVMKSKIEARDMERHMERAREFLQQGSSVKITVQLLRVHKRFGHPSMEERHSRVDKLLETMRTMLQDDYSAEASSVSRGTRLSVLLTAKPVKKDVTLVSD